MNTNRAQLKSLLLSVLFASIAGAGLWLEARLHFTLLRVLTVSFGILTVGMVIYAMWKRQTSPATRLSSKAFRRLWVCGFTLLASTFVALGTKLAYDRAYGLVHPGRSLAERTLESVGISKYQVVSFPSADGLTLHGWYVPPRNGAVMIWAQTLSVTAIGKWPAYARFLPNVCTFSSISARFWPSNALNPGQNSGLRDQKDAFCPVFGGW